jgi:hypothetical protein
MCIVSRSRQRLKKRKIKKTICESPFSAWPIQHGRLAAKGRDYKLS